MYSIVHTGPTYCRQCDWFTTNGHANVNSITYYAAIMIQTKSNFHLNSGAVDIFPTLGFPEEMILQTGCLLFPISGL